MGAWRIGGLGTGSEDALLIESVGVWGLMEHVVLWCVLSFQHLESQPAQLSPPAWERDFKLTLICCLFGLFQGHTWQYLGLTLGSVLTKHSLQCLGDNLGFSAIELRLATCK